MTDSEIRPISSLRTKFLLYTTAVALAVFTIGLAAVVSVHLSTRALDEAIEDALKEQYPLLRVEKLVRMAEMEAHDFLMYGNEAHRDQYRNASEHVDRAFEDVLRAPFDTKDEALLAEEAFDSWKTLTAGILNYPGEGPGADPLSEMEGFDRDAESILERLETLMHLVSRKIDTNLADAYGVKMRLLFLVTASFLVCLGIVLLLGVKTARSVLGPVRDLTRGVVQIGRGEYSERVPVRDGNELTLLSRAFNAMAERLEKDRALIEQLSVKDQQTGLYNRRAFESMLADEIHRVHRNPGFFSIIRLDLWPFETGRANPSESAVLRLLQGTASTITANIRVVDRGAYLGGGQFGILLRDTAETGARTKAEALRRKMEEAGISALKPPLGHFDVRIGVAACPGDAATVDGLVRAAEADMQDHS